MQRGRRASDIGTKTLGSRLQIVPPEALGESRPGFSRPARLGIDTGSGLGKTRNSSSGDALGHAGAGEDIGSGEARLGLDDGEPRRRHLGRREPLADSACERVRSAEEERDVGAERRADRQQPLERPVEAPQAVQREQRRRRVRAAAAQPGAGRDALVDA